MTKETKKAFVSMHIAALLLVASLAGAPVAAQTVTGVLGSPSATTTIQGKQLPPPPPKIRRRHQGKRRGFEALVATTRRATEGRAERAAHHDG